MVLKIIGGAFFAPPRQWYDPESPRTVGLTLAMIKSVTFFLGHPVQEIVSNLEKDVSKLFEWFKSNGMVANSTKFHIMVLGLNGKGRCVLTFR